MQNIDSATLQQFKELLDGGVVPNHTNHRLRGAGYTRPLVKKAERRAKGKRQKLARRLNRR